MTDVDINVLVGKTVGAVTQQSDEVRFHCTDGTVYRLTHFQDCCESVQLDDVCGNFDDIINSPILVAEEVSNDPPARGPTEYGPESETWTFYKLATFNGEVTLRWYGTSNGYYSERVDFEQVK